MHDVDENALSISRGGGWQSHGSFAGVAHRDMYHSPSYVSDYVASSNIQKYEIIRMGTMSTKTGTPSRFMVVRGWAIEQCLMVLEFIEGICTILSIL